MKFKLIFWSLLSITVSCQSQAVTKLQEKDSIHLDPAVRYGKLENGFTYYLMRTDSVENAVRFDLVVKAGRDHEDEDQREFAHLLEHLLAKETRSYPNLRTYFYQEGRTRHAFTKTQHTEYFATIPSYDKYVFTDGLQVLTDWTHGNVWEPSSIAVERAAIEGEMRTNDPYGKWKSNSLARQVLKKLDYRPYNADKSLANLKNFDPGAFYRFYKDWYRPDLQAAIIVGDINMDSLEMVIKDRFGALKGPTNPPNAQKYLNKQTVHFDGKVHFSTVIDSLEEGISLEILRVRPNLTLSPKSRGDYREMVLQQLYMSLLEKRAKNFTRRYDPPFSHFWANYHSSNLAGGQINATKMSLTIEGDDFPGLRKQFQRGIKAWKQLHLELGQIEFREVKREVLSNYRKPDLINDFSERLQEHFVHGKAAPAPEVEAKLIEELLKEISVKDLETFVKKKGSLDKNTHLIFFKGKNIELPKYEVFKQWIKQVEKIQIEPLTAPAPPIQTLEDVIKIPTPVSIKDVEVEENRIGVFTVELPNGIKFVLKPTEPKLHFYKNRVSIHGFRVNEIPLDNPEDYLAAQAATEVIIFGGAGSYSKFELKRFVYEKQMNLHLGMDKDNQLIFGNSKAEDLPELINLLYLYFAHPRQDPEAFKAWKTYKRKGLRGKGTRGSAAFILEKITPLWYPEVPVMDMENLEQLKAEHVYRAAEQWFSSLEDYTFIVTGDFDTHKVLSVLINKLSGFPIKKGQIVVSSKNLEFPLKKMQEKLEYKNIDAAYVRLFFPVKVQKDLKTQIELKLLSQALHRSIRSRLREGSYAPIAKGEWLDVEKDIFTFEIEFDSRLGEEGKMIKWALEEFRSLRDQGVKKEWLERAIAEEIRNYENGFGSFHYYDFWRGYLQRKLKTEEDLEKEVLEYGTILEHFISHEDVNTAAKKYMKEDNLQQFVGFPEGYHNLK